MRVEVPGRIGACVRLEPLRASAQLRERRPCNLAMCHDEGPGEKRASFPARESVADVSPELAPSPLLETGMSPLNSMRPPAGAHMPPASARRGDAASRRISRASSMACSMAIFTHPCCRRPRGAVSSSNASGSTRRGQQPRLSGIQHGRAASVLPSARTCTRRRNVPALRSVKISSR